MTDPIVYDVLIRQEVEGFDSAQTLKEIDEALVSGESREVHAAYQVIRDYNKYLPKDYLSREDNGFVVFTSEQKHQLLKGLKHAPDAAGNEDPAPGAQLLKTLALKSHYVANNTFIGVEL